MKIPKSIYSALLLFSLSQSYASPIKNDGNCISIGESSICKSERVHARPFSPKNFQKKLDSVVDIKKILKHSKNVKEYYGNFDSSILAKAIISVENSDVNPNAVSQAEAVGLMQMTLKTAGMRMSAVKDREMNIILGMEHFNTLYERYKGKESPVKFALAAYLAGETNLDSVMKFHDVRNWNDLEDVVNNGLTSRLQDSNGTNVIDYASKIIRNYGSIKELESKKGYSVTKL